MMDVVMNSITDGAYKQAAEKLGVDVATIKAVAEVESKGNGFLSTGEPVILFERHVFSRLTSGRYDIQHADVSNPVAGGYGKTAEQHRRLQKAVALDRRAALQSASWGRFQIMGFNYKAAGFKTLQDFINAMYKSEDAQLDAFVGFILHEGLASFLKSHDWQGFARYYNGPAYKYSQYDEKLAKAYEKYAGIY